MGLNRSCSGVEAVTNDLLRAKARLKKNYEKEKKKKNRKNKKYQKQKKIYFTVPFNPQRWTELSN